MVMYKHIIILLSLVVFSTQTKKKVDDLFNGLYDKDIYSGYLETGNPNHQLFYIFTPSQSDTPTTAPLILWLHGGPGCSAIDSLLIEMGPVVTDKFSGKFHVNEFSWNKEYNVLYLESPAGVGYTINTDEKKTYNEQISSTESVYALGKFFEEFPEYKDVDFYISGFSYSGINIPFFVKAFYEQSEYTVNLKGLFIGNGYTSYEGDMENAMVHMGYGHGLISEELMREFERNCPHLDFLYRNKPDVPEQSTTSNTIFPRKLVTKRCNEIRTEIRNCFEGVELYGMYRKCRKGATNDYTPESLMYKLYEKQRSLLVVNEEEKKEETTIWPSFCNGDPFMSDFVNSETTKEKLGVDQSKQWIYCDFSIFDQYDGEESYPLYKDVLLKHDIKIWHFSGDGDMCIPTIGTLYWMDKLGLNITTQWRQWHTHNQVAGYLQEYDNKLAIITFIGAGHQVPSDRREESLKALNGLIKGELPQ